MTLQYIKPIRSQLCGKHAIKIKIDMTKYHPQYDVTVHSVEYKYQVVSGNYLFTLAVMGYQFRKLNWKLLTKWQK